MILHPTLCCSHLQKWPLDAYIKAHYISYSLERPLQLKRASPQWDFILTT